MNRELEQFFTCDSISSFLARSLQGVNPRIVVDVGAGEGALLKAVKQRWGKARLLGVDIDPGLRGSDLNGRIERIHGNGLDHKLPILLQELCGGVDLAVSNPPYMAIPRCSGTEIILKESELLEAVGESKNYPAELVFFAQNLRIVKNGGTLAIIVPSGMVNNNRWVKFREVICKSHKLEKVIELPENAFEKTEAKTFILVLRKGGTTDSVELSNMQLNARDSHKVRISANEAIRRMDWSHYNWMSQRKSKTQAFCLRELEARVFRGQLSASEARKKGAEIYHSSDMQGRGELVELSQKSITNTSYKTIQKGDILVARVGSRCIGRTARVTGGQAIISDGIYVVRVPEKYQEIVWERISSKSTYDEFKQLSRGVCAKYLTKEQILDLPLIG